MNIRAQTTVHTAVPVCVFVHTQFTSSRVTDLIINPDVLEALTSVSGQEKEKNVTTLCVTQNKQQ